MEEEVPKFTKVEFRQIQYLTFFAIFIILFQVFQYITTKNTTKQYQTLFSQVTDLVVIANSVATDNALIHRSIINLTTSKDLAEIKKFENILHSSEIKIDKNLIILQKKIISYNIFSLKKTLLFEYLKVQKENYQKKGRDYLLLNQSTEEEKANYRKNFLRPALDAFQTNQHSFLMQIYADQQLKIEEISDKADRMALTLLIAGNFLLACIIIGLIFIIFFERKNLS